MKPHLRGFSLVEFSVALAALGLVLLGAVVYWQLSERQRVEGAQQDVVQQARDALLGFAHARHRLPCPAQDAAGVEACSVGADARHMGFVPWRTLNLPRPEAGFLRYGIYREPSATAHLDRDLVFGIDRMNPLRAATAFPAPVNNNAPNNQAPRIPVVAAGLLGDTQSGDVTAPLNALCDASSAPPCPVPGGVRSVNLVDICLALNTASELTVAPAGRLAVNVAGTRRPVAFLVVAPGVLDADADGSSFDGANATATPTDPTFEAPSANISTNYDDRVVTVSHAELFSEFRCSGALSAISHAHFNAAIGAIVMERAYYDYRDQLYVAYKIADAGVYAAAAGIASAAAQVADGVKEMISATADTTLTVGARAFQIGLAAAGIAAGAVSTATAIAGQVLAVEARDIALIAHQDFAVRTTAITNVARDVNLNTLKADAIGF